MSTVMMRCATLALALSALVLGGCAAGLGSGDYQRSEARRAMNIEFGVVDSVRAVQLEGTKTPIGSATGAVIGGVGGSRIGGGSGQVIAGVLGAVAGGMAGSAVEEGITRQAGIEVTVRLESGRYVAVVQADEGENFRPGERVRVLRDGSRSRVSR